MRFYSDTMYNSPHLDRVSQPRSDWTQTLPIASLRTKGKGAKPSRRLVLWIYKCVGVDDVFLLEKADSSHLTLSAGTCEFWLN